MDIELLLHNTHLESMAAFQRKDPHLRRLQSMTYQFHSATIDEIPRKIPGVYTLVGGRQIGKTTLLKQWMLSLLEGGIKPDAIRFISCELISDMHSLNRVVNELLDEMPQNELIYIILDEITYVLDWDRAIKHLAETGLFENAIVIISGSDSVLIKDAMKRFPGRRGKADIVDFHYYPLSFREILNLKNVFPANHINYDDEAVNVLYQEFNKYLIHGGYLSAINEYSKDNVISRATLSTYSDWVRGDVLKRNKSEHYLRDILSAIFKHYNKQISWRDIVKGLRIDHYQTAIDYTHLLESMDVVYIQEALLEDKLTGAPKKNRKLMYTDPFIFHALKAWLKPSMDSFNEQILPMINDSKLCSDLVESTVVNHFRRYYPTYYIKADGEVDIAYIHDNKFWPIEVKWTRQIRKEDLKQILKYRNGKILARVNSESLVNSTPIIPLPIALLGIGEQV